MKRTGLTEAQIERQITDFLALEGWRAIKTNPCSDKSRGKGFGEIGMPDVLYLRYGSKDCFVPGLAEVMWIEHKRPGGKVSPHQADWHYAERARGALVVVATQDFAPHFDGFHAWYLVSGLLRRQGPW